VRQSQIYGKFCRSCYELSFIPGRNDFALGSQNNSSLTNVETLELLMKCLRGLWLPPLIMLCIASVTACSSNGGGSSPVANAPQVAKSKIVYIADGQYVYTSLPRYKPGSVALAGDGSYELTNMVWSTWSSTVAKGTGAATIDDCNPSCAGGRLYRIPVKVTFSKPVKACKDRYNSKQRITRFFWSRAQLTYPSGLPAPVRGAYRLWVFSELISMANQTCS
jgi:hypothetical protein